MATGNIKKARFNDSIMSAFANFSDDILFTIFLKFSDPHFIKMHTKCSNQHHQYRYKFLVKSSSKSFYSVDLETSNAKAVPRNFPSKSTSHLKIAGSCNGLLCLTIAHKKEPRDLSSMI